MPNRSSSWPSNCCTHILADPAFRWAIWFRLIWFGSLFQVIPNRATLHKSPEKHQFQITKNTEAVLSKELSQTKATSFFSQKLIFLLYFLPCLSESTAFFVQLFCWSKNVPTGCVCRCFGVTMKSSVTSHTTARSTVSMTATKCFWFFRRMSIALLTSVSFLMWFIVVVKCLLGPTTLWWCGRFIQRTPQTPQTKPSLLLPCCCSWLFRCNRTIQRSRTDNHHIPRLLCGPKFSGPGSDLPGLSCRPNLVLNILLGPHKNVIVCAWNFSPDHSTTSEKCCGWGLAWDTGEANVGAGTRAPRSSNHTTKRQPSLLKPHHWPPMPHLTVSNPRLHLTPSCTHPTLSPRSPQTQKCLEQKFVFHRKKTFHQHCLLFAVWNFVLSFNVKGTTI